MKTTLSVIAAAMLALVSIGNSAQAQSATKPEIKIGFVPGPYIDGFKAGVEPELKKKGYTVKYYEFSTGLEANTAVFKNDIDANVMQHTVFLDAYNARQKTDLAGIITVPTPPMGLYSTKHKRADTVKAGMTVVVPNDPVNLQRALWILRDLGWIKIKDNNPVDVTELDVTSNPNGLKIVPLENAQAPRALGDADFAAVQGNFAIYSRLKLTEAFALEKMTTPYSNVVAVRRGNVDAQWAKDIADGYRSDSFKNAIRNDKFYAGFVLPDYFK
jgi:D-methionine transport system substrate-binding protein